MILGDNRKHLTSVILLGKTEGADRPSKALLKDSRGRTYLERLVRLGVAYSERVIVVSEEAARYSDLSIFGEVEIVPEDRKGRGALGGILTALRRTTTRHLLCLTCDMPYVSGSFVEVLGLPKEEEHGVYTRTTFFPFVLKNDVVVSRNLITCVTSGLLSVGGFLYSIGARKAEVAGMFDAPHMPAPEIHALGKAAQV